MIQLTRVLARQFRAVLRKSVWSAAPRGARPPVVVQASRDGLHLRAYDSEVALEFYRPGTLSPNTLTLPPEALEDFEGRTDSTVTLERVEPDSVQARWEDRGVPQVREYTSRDLDNLPAFPASPAQWATVERDLLQALADAADVVAREHPRYALRRTQLRGTDGKIASTDGAQMLLQSGFRFPWAEEVLIPSLSVFGGRELPQDGPVALGKTDTHVVVRVGP